MKRALSLAVLASLAIVSFAAPPKANGKPALKAMHCAVLRKNKVDVAYATKKHLFSDYKGYRYYFCCGMCKPQFDKDPAKFSKGADKVKTPAK